MKKDTRTERYTIAVDALNILEIVVLWYKYLAQKQLATALAKSCIILRSAEI